MTTTIAEPFRSNADYIQAELDLWLKPRCRRQAHEKDARMARQDGDDGRATTADERAAAAKLEEDRGRAELDARLEAHRNRGSFVLALDDLDLPHGARVAVLCCLICAVSPDLAEQVFDRIAMHMTVTMSPEVIARVLDANSVADHLRVRRLFEEGSPLLKHVKFSGRHDRDVPEDIHSLSVRLVMATFDKLVSDRAA